MKYLKLIRYLWRYRQNYKRCEREIKALPEPENEMDGLFRLSLVLAKTRKQEEEINDKIRKLNISWLK